MARFAISQEGADAMRQVSQNIIMNPLILFIKIACILHHILEVWIIETKTKE